MARLKALGNRVTTTAPLRLVTLTATPGTEQRIRGRKWMTLREQAMHNHQHCCVRCSELGTYRPATVVDHRIPLHLGGSNDLSNLDPLCSMHHDEKSALETAARAQVGGVR